MSLSSANAAYLAGLVDGEGCIFISQTTTNSAAKGCKRGIAYRSGITISLTNLPLLQRVKKLTGVGKIRPVKRPSRKHKYAWRWSAWSIEASDLISKLLPFLVLKKRQALLQMKFQSIMRYPGSKGLSDKEWNQRQLLHEKMRRLNKRGFNITSRPLS